VYMCVCRGITEATVRQVGQRGALTPLAVIDALGLADSRCCGRCVRQVDDFVRVASDGALTAAPASAGRMRGLFGVE
jgi:bacterioferritin-associated ferredoxin